MLFAFCGLREQPPYCQRLDSSCGATPIAANERHFCFGEIGVTTEVRAGADFAKFATNRFWGAMNPCSERKTPRRTPRIRSLDFCPRSMGAMLREAAGGAVYGVAVAPKTFLISPGPELNQIPLPVGLALLSNARSGRM
jgi:hypothetical protein